AAAHTASDQAETVLYRLAVSPGGRALLGMAPRRGRLVRPLLEAGGEDTREYCRERGLSWREDPTNADPRFARTRLRHEVLGALRFEHGEPEPEPRPEAAWLEVPGSAAFGEWALEARVVNIAKAAGGGYLPSRGDALLSPGAVGERLTVRAWRHGDRMRPSGL